MPARNEEAGLEESLRSVLAQDYPEDRLEAVWVDDRSTDGTGRVMDRLREEAGGERVRVLRLDGLPEGWLGKNHAIYTGVREPQGEWLLFADADVRFEPSAFRRAVAYAEREGLDHLTLVPELELEGYWLRGFAAFSFVSFLVYRGCYRANDPDAPMGVGIGAFNLIRRRAYEKVGTYSALALRPDDDLRLGSRVKEHGLGQRMLMGSPLLSVAWYPSLGGMIRGLEKNIFAVLDYSFPKVLFYAAVVPAATVWPFLALPFTRGLPLAAHAGAALAQLATFVIVNRFLGWRVLLLAPAYPLHALLVTYAMVRSTLLVLLRGGIYWRGTFYPTSLLRRGAV
ncbi:MAG: glycosyltransferase [Rubrobacter sp.]|nr:glycosyltransferase [Rubrobacter sp.]